MKMKLAGFNIRAEAYIVDSFIIAGITMFVYYATALFAGVMLGVFSESNYYAVILVILSEFVVVYFAYFTYLTGKNGDTIGKRYYGLKIVDSSGRGPGYPRALARAIGYFVSSIVFYMGFIWIAIDKKKQGWHDKIAGTYVVMEGRK